ncbi:MAG: TerB family tellurite resistance protein [Alistipes sp.]|nr:TerB family tellurite resistance protein [Alistipes sp.]
MKSDIKNVAAFLAVAIWADGIYASEEKKILADIAEALDVDVAELTENVEISLNELEGKDEEAVQAYLIDNASALEEEDTKVLMQCAIEIVLADNVITQDEVQVLFGIADATGAVEHSDVALMLVDLIKYNPDIEIKF